DRPAAAVAAGLGAAAFTSGSHIGFAAGRYRPHDPRGFRLLAHEVGHVLHARPGETYHQDEQAARQDGAGPCGVDAPALSNAGLLTWLNRARLYLHQHKWGEDQTYDYANLLRRLTTERQSRVRAGHVWLGERGLADRAPEVLYQLAATGPLLLTVRRVQDPDAAPISHIVVTAAQLDRLLDLHHIPRVDADAWLQGRGQRDPLDLTLPGLTAPAAAPQLPFSPLLSPLPQPGGSLSPLPSLLPRPQGGSPYGPTDPESLLWGAQRPMPRTIIAPAVLDDARHGALHDEGPEAIRAPRRAPMGAVAQGVYARPAFPIPGSATGMLWEGSHVSMFSSTQGGFEAIYGFRGEFWLHAMHDLLFRRTGGRDWATRTLNRGTPGRMWSDWMFPYSFWGEPVAVYRRTTPAEARAYAEQLRAARAGMDGRPGASPLDDLIPRTWGDAHQVGPIRPDDPNSYRYSTPPLDGEKGRAAWDEAFGHEPAGFCPPGANNCINRPGALLDEALGGPGKLVIPQDDGTVVVINTPENATAANMDRYTGRRSGRGAQGPAVSDAALAEMGLVRVPLGSRMYTRALAPGGAGAGAAFVGDLWQAATGEGEVHWVRDPLLGGGSAMAAAPIEAQLARQGGMWLEQRGMSTAASSAGARLLGGSGRTLAGGPVTLVLAPLITEASMALDDRDYTRIDHYAASGRATAAAGGGLLSVAVANGVYAAVAGSEAPGIGNAAGFVIGFGGTLLVDGLFGDSIEEQIRVGMGERGCTGGVGP
ncbi:MAG TPA: DUF4157 domain-containing protein, partial [Myxococcota bacterium]|nr:DUF4157 domain-containing protein [Myxococcota bacterium]